MIDFVKTAEYEIQALISFFKKNGRLLKFDYGELREKLQEIKGSFEESINEVKISHKELRGLERPRCLRPLWQLRENEILEKIIDRHIKHKV